MLVKILRLMLTNYMNYMIKNCTELFDLNKATNKHNNKTLTK